MRTERYRLAVRWRATARLTLPARQVRKHSDEQVAAIARAIEHFGFNDPVLTDGQSGIVGRAAWWLAAQQLGLERVPTIPLAHLSDVDRRAFVIAHEALAEMAGWDEALLALELGELKDLGFDLTLTGFGDDRLAAMLVGGTEGPPPASSYSEQYGVIVLCKDEPEQQSVYEKLKAEGYSCRVVTT